jgi:UV DNA damage endonuclease
MENKIGYACTPLSLPYRTSRSFTIKNFTEDKFNKAVKENLSDLLEILKWNHENNILLFRISSDIIPFGSHEKNKFAFWKTFKNELLLCGNYIKNNNIRVSMHPGQYTVLNSVNEAVVKNSILDLEYHCKFLDSMELDYTNKIVLHIGGIYGDKKSAANRFIENFNKLSSSLKKRLIIENDDKSYNIEDVLKISEILTIPVVFDNLHHKLNPCNLDILTILDRVKKSWKPSDGAVKLHYSDQAIDKKTGSHSKFVISENFLNYYELVKDLNCDIMLEVKDKELSAKKCLRLIYNEASISLRCTEWAKYKYSVMEKGYSNYKKCSQMINSDISIREIYKFIDNSLLLPFNDGNFVNAAEHVYGYIKTKASQKEKELFIELLKNPSENKIKLKALLKKLCLKYNASYINASYYFIY